MCKEHEIGRNHIRQAKQALSSGNAAALEENMNAWAKLLFDHIKKEDEILFPWMDRALSDSQIGILFSQFREIEHSFGETASAFEKFAETV